MLWLGTSLANIDTKAMIAVSEDKNWTNTKPMLYLRTSLTNISTKAMIAVFEDKFDKC